MRHDRLGFGGTLLALGLLAAGCASGGNECEGTLKLAEGDNGSARGVDSCTSVLVHLTQGLERSWSTAPVIEDPSLLRFDYYVDADGARDYYLTPLGRGRTGLTITATPPTAAFSATLVIDLTR